MLRIWIHVFTLGLVGVSLGSVADRSGSENEPGLGALEDSLAAGFGVTTPETWSRIMGPDPFRILPALASADGEAGWIVLLRGTSEVARLDAHFRVTDRATTPSDPSSWTPIGDRHLLVGGEGSGSLALFSVETEPTEVARLELRARSIRGLAFDPTSGIGFALDPVDDRAHAFEIEFAGRPGAWSTTDPTGRGSGEPTLVERPDLDLELPAGPLTALVLDDLLITNSLLGHTISIHRRDSRRDSWTRQTAQIIHDGPVWSFDAMARADTLWIAAGGVEDQPLDRTQGEFGNIDSFLFLYRAVLGTDGSVGPLQRAASWNLSAEGVVTPKRIVFESSRQALWVSGFGGEAMLRISWMDGPAEARPRITRLETPPGISDFYVDTLHGNVVATSPLLDRIVTIPLEEGGSQAHFGLFRIGSARKDVPDTVTGGRTAWTNRSAHGGAEELLGTDRSTLPEATGLLVTNIPHGMPGPNPNPHPDPDPATETDPTTDRTTDPATDPATHPETHPPTGPPTGPAAGPATDPPTDPATARELRLGELLVFTTLLTPGNRADGPLSRFTCETCHFEGGVDGRTHFTGRDHVFATTKPIRGLGPNVPLFSRAGAASFAAMVPAEFRVANQERADRHWITEEDHPWIGDSFSTDAPSFSATTNPTADTNSDPTSISTAQPRSNATPNSNAEQRVEPRFSPEEQRRAVLRYLYELRPIPHPKRAADWTPAEIRGLDVFRDRCASCHMPLRTNRTESSRVPFREWADWLSTPDDDLIWGAPFLMKAGITPYVSPAGARVTSLRRAAWKRPYFTNGSAQTLEEVLDRFRYGRAMGWHEPPSVEAGSGDDVQPLTLGEKRDLRALLDRF